MEQPAQDLKILLVEDAATMRKIEVKTLASLGYNRIVEAVDGLAAIDCLEKEPDIGLIISDWHMPNKNGYDLLCFVRGDDRFARLPFLMATGQGDKKQENIAIEAGVSSFVAKPFAPDELKHKIQEALGLQTARPPVAEVVRERTTASGRLRLQVAHIQITDHLILGILQHLIQKGELVPQHFEMELSCMPGWNPVKKALETNQVDAACILAPIAMDLFGYGVPIQLILLAHRGGSIFVRNRLGTWQEPFADFFRNRAFYIPHQLSIHHILAHAFFSTMGLKPGMAGQPGVDVNFEVVPPVKMAEFLKGNAAAGGFMVAEPIGTRAIAGGIAELQFLSSELWERHPCCVVAMRRECIASHPEAVQEFTNLLVEAGKFIEKKPEQAAEIAVTFLDPKKELGLKVPILKNVLTELQGIKTGDLFPDVTELQQMQDYLAQRMGVGSLIELDQFVDLRFAEIACKDRPLQRRTGFDLNRLNQHIQAILERSADTGASSKAMLSREGKYLTFRLGEQEFGIDILRIKEIIGLMPIRTLPQAPTCIAGVINLRGQVIPVMDLRCRLEMAATADTERNCIVIVETQTRDSKGFLGLKVDTVSEVVPVKSSDIEDTPYFGSAMDTSHILAMAKVNGHVKLLLDVDRIASA